VVLPFPKISSPAKFSDYRWREQMERDIRCNNLLTVFQSGFRRHHSTATAVLKVTKDIRLSMEDGQVKVLLLLNFS
jgi:hypothetical protein